MTVAGIESLDLLTVEQAAKRLQVERTTIYRLIRRGELEAIKVGRNRRIAPAALADYITGQRVKAQAEAKGAA